MRFVTEDGRVVYVKKGDNVVITDVNGDEHGYNIIADGAKGDVEVCIHEPGIDLDSVVIKVDGEVARRLTVIEEMKEALENGHNSDEH